MCCPEVCARHFLDIVFALLPGNIADKLLSLQVVKFELICADDVVDLGVNLPGAGSTCPCLFTCYALPHPCSVLLLLFYVAFSFITLSVISGNRLYCQICFCSFFFFWSICQSHFTGPFGLGSSLPMHAA